MTDFLQGQLRPNWASNTGYEAVTSNFEYITVSTNVDIRTYAQNLAAGATQAVATASQNNLNKLIEIVSLRGQPVIMGLVTTATHYWSLFLATEHAGGWAVMGTGTSVGAAGANSLLGRLVADGINFGFGAVMTAVTPVTSAAVFNSQLIPVGSTTGILNGDTFTGTGVVGGVVQEVLSATLFVATLPQTISTTTTLTMAHPFGTGYDDTPSSGSTGGLAVTFNTVLT